MAFVISSVTAFLEHRVLPYAKSSKVLELRHALLDSLGVSDAVEAIKAHIDPIFHKYASKPTRVGAQGKHKVLPDATGFSLRDFVELCDEAQLIGGSLSRMQVKSIFIYSLEITAESANDRRPLLSRSEFDEALLRICMAFEPPPEELKALAGTPGLRRRASIFDQDGDERATKFAQELSVKVATPRNSTPRGTPGSIELTILERLPVVCGRMLAIFEQHYVPSGPGRFLIT